MTHRLLPAPLKRANEYWHCIMRPTVFRVAAVSLLWLPHRRWHTTTPPAERRDFAMGGVVPVLIMQLEAGRAVGVVRA